MSGLFPSPTGATAPRRRGPPHYRGFTNTLRHITVGGTPLDEWSARRRDLYLRPHNTLKRQTSMSAAVFEPTIPASERPQTHGLRSRGHWDRREWSRAYRPIISPLQLSVFKECHPPVNLQSLQLIGFTLESYTVYRRGRQNFFRDGPENKYFRFCGPRWRGKIRDTCKMRQHPHRLYPHHE